MERTSVSMPGNIKAVNYKTLDFSPLFGVFGSHKRINFSRARVRATYMM